MEKSRMKRLKKENNCLKISIFVEE